MLLQFTVRNFRSFGEAAVFSLLANNKKSQDPQLDAGVRRPVLGGLNALTSAAVFGPNASGKSNLFKALLFFTTFVKNSAREGQVDDPIGVDPFRLKAPLEQEPTSFEIIFTEAGERYRYGFDVSRDRVQAEWLYRTRKRESLLFEREGDDYTGQQVMDVQQLGPHTRSNALFLSVAAQLNHPIAQQLVRWTQGIGFIEGLRTTNIPYTARQLADDTPLAPAIRQLLVDLDLSFKDIQATRQKIDPSDVPANLPTRLYEQLFPHKVFRITTQHPRFADDGAAKAPVAFELADESDGTQKLFGMAGPLIDVLRRGGLMIVDEFDARLHPMMGRRILKLFNDPTTNPNRAQLIIMTHDAHMLDLACMRRDQLWFVDKDRFGQSELYSLSEFKDVRNNTAVHKAYLQGRFGAVPRIRVTPEVLLGQPR
jgi:hypothetical protein